MLHVGFIPANYIPFFPSAHIYSTDTEDNAAEDLPATSKVCLYITMLKKSLTELMLYLLTPSKCASRMRSL